MFERLKWLLPALSLLVAMILLSASSRQPGRGGAMSSLVMEVAGPVERLMTSSARGVERFWGRYLARVGVSRENEKLRAMVADQGRQLSLAAEYKASNDRLSSLLGLRQAYPHLLMKPAYVLAWDPGPWYHSLIISVGAGDGLAVDQAVIHPQGIVGRVVEVTPNYARVLLATDFHSSIDAFIQRTRAVGILSGQGGRPMSLKYIRKEEDVRPGDAVVTSGLDGLFPRGLTLGTVSRVDRHGPDLFMVIEVNPQVPFDRLEEVMVVVNQGPPIDWLRLASRLRPFVEEAEEARRRALAEEGAGE